jgi:hypothetical protein
VNIVIKNMEWGLPVVEAGNAINALAEQSECDPIVLTANTLAVALANAPERIPVAVQVFGRSGFKFRAAEHVQLHLDLEAAND